MLVSAGRAPRVSGAWLCLLFGLWGCSADDAGGCTSDPAVREALVGGAPEEHYLELGSEPGLAIGLLSGSGAGECSGTQISADFVLSAAHCAVIEAPVFRPEGSPARRVVHVVSHPAEDVALFELEPPACGDAAGSSLPVARLADPDVKLSRGVIAGYGLDAGGELGTRAFLVEPIAELDRSSVTVDGRGRTGACAGDSGGPILIRDDTGRPAVLGVLSAGESSCRGRDVYVRVDGLGAWFAQYVRDTVNKASEPIPCGALDERGRCFDELATWCEGGELRAERCHSPSVCGLIEGSGFRCAPAPVCTGDERGHCTEDGTASLRCSEEGATRERCATECAFDSETGEALCDQA